jgi:7-cyano-7-deazaguanine synthase in queuosine biosynthesis
MKTSSLLKYHHISRRPKILRIPAKTSEVYNYFFDDNPLLRELQELAIALFLIDRSYPETQQLDFEMNHRNIWEGLIEEIEKLTEFLTERKIKINLIERSQEDKFTYQAQITKNDSYFNSLSGHNVCLFSGGADSTAGIVKLLEKEKYPILHHSLTGNIVYGRVKKLHKEMPILNSELFISDMRDARKLGNSALRGFVFIINAFLVARYLGCKRLVFPENGPLMLNPPMSCFKDPTKNAHPYLITNLEKIFKSLSGEAFKIDCIFKDKTKAEVVIPLITTNLISKTNSCFFVQGQKNMCGNCFACFVRRFSLIALDYLESSAYSTDPFLTSCPLCPDHETMKDLHDSLFFLFNILTGKVNIGDYLANVPDNFFQDPSILFRNFAADIFLGVRKYFERINNSQTNALGRFAKDLTTSIDKHMLDLREEELLALIKSKV